MAKTVSNGRQALRNFSGIAKRRLGTLTSGKKTSYKTGKEPAGKRDQMFLRTFQKIPLKGRKGQAFAIRLMKSGFEANNSVTLSSGPISLKHHTIRPENLADARVGFTGNAVIVEALQGRKGKQALLERFRQMHKMPWANHLLKAIEEHARKIGFKQVKIRVPESLYYYQKPATGIPPEISKAKEQKKGMEKDIRQGMLALYSNAAEAMGYKRKGNFFVKRL